MSSPRSKANPGFGHPLARIGLRRCVGGEEAFLSLPIVLFQLWTPFSFVLLIREEEKGKKGTRLSSSNQLRKGTDGLLLFETRTNKPHLT